jgi:hypothetical protein
VWLAITRGDLVSRCSLSFPCWQAPRRKHLRLDKVGPGMVQSKLTHIKLQFGSRNFACSRTGRVSFNGTDEVSI